ncbi:MAG: phosphate ABC transporter ATP-binding protein PstB [Firmicutes bacterium]|jgi:phosphate transport system ATP-binding protein|nr:phosphate ABC transporter ATP-binding protein PstB [Bacillota bacterium]MDH7494794.1 phosphate ABC transporter ATP-binding protein PstB [Bacillota bacterium]
MSVSANEDVRDREQERTRRHKIEISNLNLYYGLVHALKGVTLSIIENSITALIGPSGCGKSTLLRCMNRMNDVIENVRIEGSIRLDGEDIYAPEADVTRLRQRVGMVFQRPVVFPLSIYENVACAARVHGIGDRKSLDPIVEESLRRVGLWDEVKDKLRSPGLGLSLGQQQQLCIARVIATGPDVILLDEPCSALDPASTLRIEDLMRELQESYTVVIVTHNMQQAARASDHTAFMLSGELVEYGPTGQVFTSPADRRTENYVAGRLG